MVQQPFGFAHMFGALDFYLQKPKEIVLVGERNNKPTGELIRRIHSLYLPNKTFQLVQPGEPLGKISSALEGKSQLNGKPTVYVCQNFTCSPPMTQWEEVEGLLNG
jgi:uncharacterized protein YyaL (SSP411 family)